MFSLYLPALIFPALIRTLDTMLTGKPDGRTLPSGQGFPTLHGLSSLSYLSLFI
nr:MAG TPA_asm: hypothetical protein [Caudoviricetes sp.]